ncbi:MAG TPA: hypothetical protein DDW41_04835 [Candidatus Andersenbacteria bacterium]|nr:hypothetical protein [Candidatus Andersenbacteria bacterium]
MENPRASRGGEKLFSGISFLKEKILLSGAASACALTMVYELFFEMKGSWAAKWPLAQSN